MAARISNTYQVMSQAEGIINYTTSRNIEGVTKFNNLVSLVRELKELFEAGAKVEQVRICGATEEGHQYLGRILPNEICFGMNFNVKANEVNVTSNASNNAP